MKPIGDEVRRELSRFGPVTGMAELVEAWPEAVGDAIARNAWPARLGRDGTLHVATTSSAWAFELAQLEPQLLASLGHVAGGVTPPRLRFAVGRLPEPAAEPPAAARTAAEPSPADLEEARRLTEHIDDEELREAVAEAVGRGLAEARSGRGL